ncbi:MAG: trypsin-like peptidase domain-containing protein [Archangiaceae bacterium]|nr:trypsin-like peptidase domain-containing protein [Archangiaceae bacterium]
MSAVAVVLAVAVVSSAAPPQKVDRVAAAEQQRIKPWCQGAYATDFSALSTKSIEFSARAENQFTYCLRVTATYECVSYAQDGTIKRAKKNVVAHGTAFAYRRDKADTLLATNQHVVEYPIVTDEEHLVDGVPSGCKRVTDSMRIVENERDDYEADDVPLTRVISDAALDLSVVRAKNQSLHVMPWKFGKSSALRERNVVDVRGFPLGAFKATNLGTVISTYDRDDFKEWDHDDFVIDARLSQGNSGSPVLAVSCATGEYELVGIFHAGYSRGSSLNVVVQIDQARDFLTFLKKSSTPRPDAPSGLVGTDDRKRLYDAASSTGIFFPFGSLSASVRAREGKLVFDVYPRNFPTESWPALVIEDVATGDSKEFGSMGRVWFGNARGLKEADRAEMNAEMHAQLERGLEVLRRAALAAVDYPPRGDEGRRLARGVREGQAAREDPEAHLEHVARDRGDDRRGDGARGPEGRREGRPARPRRRAPGRRRALRRRRGALTPWGLGKRRPVQAKCAAVDDPLIRGRSLREWLGAKRRSFDEVLTVMLEAGRDLEAGHAAGRVHCDFQPESVRVGDDGRVVVTSRDAGESASATPLYLAPEQLAAEPTSALTDQFAFGVVLYEALYGQHPFLGAVDGAQVSPAEIGTEVMKGEVKPPPSGSDAPPGVTPIIERLLQYDEVDRYPSMREAIAALEALRPRRPKRWVLVGAGLVLVVVGGAAVPAWRYTHREERVSLRSAVPGAARAFDDGVAVWKTGSTEPARRKLRQALQRDPDFALAWLYLALLEPDPALRREALLEASLHPVQLGDTDTALLAALAPRPDLPASSAAVDQALARRPGDGRLLLLRGRLRALRDDAQGARADLDALERDPELFAVGAAERARFERERRTDVNAALAATEHCLEVAPRSTDCLEHHTWLVGNAGECATLAREAREWAQLDPEEPRAWQLLADALFASGEGWAPVDEALAARQARPGGDRRAQRQSELSALAARGDLAGARREAQADLDALALQASPLEQLEVSLRLLSVLEAVGDREASVALARQVLDRAREWKAERPHQLAATLRFAYSLYHDGALSPDELGPQRDRWLPPHGKQPAFDDWLLGFGAGCARKSWPRSRSRSCPSTARRPGRA